MSSALALRLFFAAAAFAPLAACTGSDTPTADDSFNVTPPGAIDGGADGSTPDGSAPACDPNASPVPTCLVNEATAVFVSSSLGSDANDGSRAKPVKSLAAALAAAAPTKKRIYACAENYDESVTLVDGVSLFGYFDCTAQWSVDTKKFATIHSPSSPAIVAKNLTLVTRLEGVSVVAPNAATAGGSSIGLLADHAPTLVIATAKIQAGDAQDGTDGATPDGYSLTNPDGAPVVRGVAATLPQNYGPFPPVGQENVGRCTLPGNVDSAVVLNQGGLGFPANKRANWNGASWTVVGEDPLTKYTRLNAPDADLSKNAEGSHFWRIAAITKQTNAQNGANGTNGTNGANGGILGTFQADGTYTSTSGSAGTDGTVGLGGGGGMGWLPSGKGGYADSIYVGAGAQGGIGGCPGRAGTAGTGGGASVAILALDSSFTLRNVAIVAGRGGRGGVGSAGAAPTPGTLGGLGVYDPIYPETTGGAGGYGGSAGASGHGGSGPSFGIAYKGSKPVATAVDTTLAAPAQGRPELVGGSPAAPVTVPATPAGLSEATHAL
jgi:hypothetical protein